MSLIVVAAVGAAIFVYPKYVGQSFRPWRLGCDLAGGSYLVYEADLSSVSANDRDSILNGLRDVIERRVNLFGVSEPQVFIAQSGNKANLIAELCGVGNIAEAIRQIGETPLLDFREVEQNGTSTILVLTNLTGRYLVNSQLGFSQNTTKPEIDFTLNDTGAKIFQQMTRKNLNKPLCVFIDNEPIIPDNLSISCPYVNEEIPNGKAVITGQFDVNLAKKIVARLNAGALPAPINLISQQTISPTLGTDSLKKAIFAGLIGTLLVMLFMLGYYRFFGIFAALALVIYIALTLGIFKIIPITLSLSGLAGFILTIGMAVDANILIFERVKEEIKKGLSWTAAIEEGFRRAWPSIRDSNISTIITAIILYESTSSFVQGFALTLFIGVLVSMFSAITTTRLFLRVFVKNRR